MSALEDEASGELEDEADELGEHDPTDETEPDDNDDQEASPEPAASVKSERDIEAALKRLDAEATRHANRVSEIMGADAQDLVPCPLCAPNIPGFRFPVPPDDEQRAVVMTTLGVEPGPEYKPADDARACEKCDALGKVLTGSLVDEHRTKLCAACDGTGWIQVPGPGATVATLSMAPITTAAAPVVSEYAMPADAWQRPWGHPDYGRPPAMVNG